MNDVIAVLESLPQRLRFARAALGLSLRDVEAATGVSFNTVHRIERGSTDPVVSNAVSLLRWLDSVADDLREAERKYLLSLRPLEKPTNRSNDL